MLTAALASQNFNFPSLIIYISASPLVYVPSAVADKTQVDKIMSAQETDRNPLWLDATFTLVPEDAEGHEIGAACSDGSVRILGLLPQQTASGTKSQTLADVASGGRCPDFR